MSGNLKCCLRQGAANIFHQGPDCKYFKFCGPLYSLSNMHIFKQLFKNVQNILSLIVVLTETGCEL